MTRPERVSSMKAFPWLNAIAEDDSEDESEGENVCEGLDQGLANPDQVQLTWEVISSNGSDSETDIDDLEQTDFVSCQLVSSGSGSVHTSTSAQAQSDGFTLNTSEIGLVDKNGTKWEYIKFLSESRGRQQAHLTRYANRMLDGPLSAFELLVNNSMLAHIQQCKEAETHRVKNSDEWKLPLSELKAFICLLYVRGVLCGKNRPILEFWDKVGEYFFSRSYA